MLDILASSKNPVRYKELPYQFRDRHAGESKLSSQVIIEYGMLLVDKTVGKVIPIKYFMFVCVGLLGVFIHLTILGVLLNILEVAFFWGQMAGTVVAMTSNYILNNITTFSEQKRTGFQFLVGICYFYLICSVGAIINIQIATILYGHGFFWWLAGFLGIVVGSVWNYAISSTWVWRKK